MARCQTAELLEPIEEAFDQIACLVTMPVDLCGVSRCRREGITTCAPASSIAFTKGIAVVAFVGNHGLCRDRLDESLGLGNVSFLATGEDQSQGVAQRIDTGMDFGCQPAT